MEITLFSAGMVSCMHMQMEITPCRAVTPSTQQRYGCLLNIGLAGAHTHAHTMPIILEFLRRQQIPLKNESKACRSALVVAPASRFQIKLDKPKVCCCTDTAVEPGHVVQMLLAHAQRLILLNCATKLYIGIGNPTLRLVCWNKHCCAVLCCAVLCCAVCCAVLCCAVLSLDRLCAPNPSTVLQGWSATQHGGKRNPVQPL